MKNVVQKVALFFAEAFKRWGQKSPKYLRIWRTINAVLLAIGTSGLSASEVGALFPGKWGTVAFWVLTFIGAYGIAMNTLVVSEPKGLPLTEKLQEEKAAKSN